jgi:hypothetical protein
MGLSGHGAERGGDFLQAGFDVDGRLSRFEAAKAAFTKAAGADLPGAKAAQAELIGSGGNPQRAVELLTETLTGLSPDNPETLGIRSMLAASPTRSTSWSSPAGCSPSCSTTVRPGSARTSEHLGGSAAGRHPTRRVPRVHRGGAPARRTRRRLQARARLRPSRDTARPATARRLDRPARQILGRAHRRCHAGLRGQLRHQVGVQVKGSSRARKISKSARGTTPAVGRGRTVRAGTAAR